MKTFHFDDKETEVLVEKIRQAITELEEKRATYLALLDKLKLSSSATEYQSSLNGDDKADLFSNENVPYNEDWTWTKKITYVLNKERQAMDKKSIENHLCQLDNQINSDRKTAGRSISATLSRQAKNGIFKSYQNDEGVNIYGMPKWFENSKIASEYKNKSILEDA